MSKKGCPLYYLGLDKTAQLRNAHSKLLNWWIWMHAQTKRFGTVERVDSKLQILQRGSRRTVENYKLRNNFDFAVGYSRSYTSQNTYHEVIRFLFLFFDIILSCFILVALLPITQPVVRWRIRVLSDTHLEHYKELNNTACDILLASILTC